MFKIQSEPSSDGIAIDPGTARTRIYSLDTGLLLNEPSLGAEQRGHDPTIKAWGDDALEMAGAEPDRYHLIRASAQDRNGATMIAPMLRYFLRKLRRNGLIGSHFHAALATPSTFGSDELERQLNTCRVSGAIHTQIVDRAAASSAGAGIDRHHFDNPVLMDLGASGAEMCGYSSGEMVFYRQLPIGGDALDLALQDGMREEFDMLIHAGAASETKHRIGTARIDDQDPISNLSYQITGRDVVSGRIRNLRVGVDTVHELLLPALDQLQRLTVEACDCLPAALADSLHHNGLRLSGGGSALLNLPDLLADVLDIPVSACERPLTATARGAAQMLQQAGGRRRDRAAPGMQKMLG